MDDFSESDLTPFFANQQLFRQSTTFLPINHFFANQQPRRQSTAFSPFNNFFANQSRIDGQSLMQCQLALGKIREIRQLALGKVEKIYESVPI